MNPLNASVPLFHMLEAAEKAVALIQNRQRPDLDTNDMLVLALTRLLEMIGEAANSISSELQAQHPKIPWRHLIDARHQFAHAYFDVDHDLIWEIITRDLSPMITVLKELLEDFGR